MKIFLQMVWSILFCICSLAMAQETRLPNAVDTAELLTVAELDALDETLKSIDRKYQVRVAVVTVSHTENLSIEHYAHRLLQQYFSNGQNGNMLLLIDRSSRRWYVALDQKIALDNNAIAFMRDAMLPSLKRGDYAGAFHHYAQATETCLKKASFSPHAQAVSDTTSPKETKTASIFEFNSRTLIGSVVASLLIAVLIGRWLRGKMSNIASAWEADHYLVHDSFELTKENDHFLYTSRTLIPKPRQTYSGPGPGNQGGMRGGGGSF